MFFHYFFCLNTYNIKLEDSKTFDIKNNKIKAHYLYNQYNYKCKNKFRTTTVIVISINKAMNLYIKYSKSHESNKELVF